MFKHLTNFFHFLSSLWFGNALAFDYDLHLSSIPGTNSRTMICFHGYGGNYKIAETLKNLGMIESTLISFNFPDHDLSERNYDPHQLTFRTIKELLPACYVLKELIIGQGFEAIDLYGRSAGGGALVNLIAVLNTSSFDAELKGIGIGSEEKTMILRAIQRGIVILDVPLKSVEEIIDLRGSSSELEIIVENYRENHLRPIDSLGLLKGLSLDVIIHFQEPDEIIFNRDDAIYIERFKQANIKGTTSVVIGHDGGHISPHWSLWRFFTKKIS